MLSLLFSAQNASTFKLVILNVVIIILVVAIVLILGWLQSKRKQAGVLGDIDWEEEKEKLEALAAERLAQRNAESLDDQTMSAKEDDGGGN